MVNSRPHVAFFSQTGSEIVRLASTLGKYPDYIVTNRRPEHLREIHPELLTKQVLTLSNTPSIKEYREVLQKVENPVITLHGWLRVIPAELTAEYEIYNGHPGLITQWPSLKGKDPQIRAWEAIKRGEMDRAGCVIHRVSPEVDEGEILVECSLPTSDISTEQEFFEKLSDLSLTSWKIFTYYLENETQS